jgi:hypothetical protein
VLLNDGRTQRTRKLFFSLSNIDFSDLGLTFSIERVALLKFPALIKFLSVIPFGGIEGTHDQMQVDRPSFTDRGKLVFFH